jgi:hypothetical protein
MELIGDAEEVWKAGKARKDTDLTDLLQLATRSRRNLLIPHKAMPSNAKS